MTDWAESGRSLLELLTLVHRHCTRQCLAEQRPVSQELSALRCAELSTQIEVIGPAVAV